MVKAFGTLIFRGIVGVASIAATAVITVLVQRYLYEKTGTPTLIPAPPAASTPAAEPSQVRTQPSEAEQFESTDVAPQFEDSQGATEKPPDSPVDRKTKIMEQFWDKLNQ